MTTVPFGLHLNHEAVFPNEFHGLTFRNNALSVENAENHDARNSESDRSKMLP